MASPVMGALPSPGNLIASASLAASASTGILFDCTSVFEGQLDVSDTTGGTAASTSGLTVGVYHIAASTTLSTSYSSGVTSIAVASATGINKGQKIALGGTNGEIVTVSAISGTTLTVSTTQYAHSTDPVYLIDQTASIGPVTLGYNLTAANTTYSQAFFVPTAYWWLSVANTDVTNAITIAVTSRQITSVQ